MSKRVFTIVFILLVLTSVFWFQKQNFTYQKEVFEEIENEVLFVPDGEKIKNFTFGYENLVTDLIWLKTVQYIGGNARHQRFHLLGDYLESVTDLDSKFYAPYFLGLLLLPDIEQGKQAVQLAEKGIQALPNRWEIPYYLGYVYYFYLEDYEKGAEMYEKASKMPGVLVSAKRMATNLQSKAGKHKIALDMWIDIYENTENEGMLELIEKKIIREKNFLDLAMAVTNFENQKGYLPNTIEELAEFKFIEKIPEDPIEYWKSYQIKNGKIVLE